MSPGKPAYPGFMARFAEIPVWQKNTKIQLRDYMTACAETHPG